MKYFIQTFGCAANEADSERISASYEKRGFTKARDIKNADHVIINTCMIRESAENRIYGLVNNLSKLKIKNCKLKIIVSGCMAGMAVRDKSGRILKILKKRLPQVDEFLPIEEVGFDHIPLRSNSQKALVPISNGCNNFCTFCIVPFTRGREISRPFEEIINEIKELSKNGYSEILLIGQNVNSYGADLMRGKQKEQIAKKIKPTFVKHLGRYRIPTLFPALLESVCGIKGIKKVDFISSNPWDFSDELIKVIAENKNISREIHLPVQSGDDEVLKRMNRWYTRDQYIKLVENLKLKIKNLKLSTDIIVGFPGETKSQFENTVALCKSVGFYKAYIAEYSDRPLTAAHKAFKDDIPHKEKKRRWRVLESLVNKPH
jgi:tRNA-2-methylthio-N6-dimethylallyladenosine synthase